MSRVRKGAETDNTIINSMMIISESFKEAHISDDDIYETMSTVQFIHYFEKLKDWRNPDMVTYKLSNLLLMAFLVILSDGINSFYGIADQIDICREKYIRYGLIEDNKVPSHDTFRRVFELLDAQELYSQTIQCFYDFLLELEATIRGTDTYKHLAVDGKEVRGSGRSENSRHPKGNVQILNVYDDGLQTCIHSEMIAEKTNEIPTAQDFLKGICLKKTVITADALHCQRKTADIISKKKGIYVLTVKENQPLLLEEIHACMDSRKSSVTVIEREKRTFEIYHLPKGYATDGFTGMKTFVRMLSKKHSAKKTDTRCFISNASDDSLIISAIEGRWCIENGFHKEKDNFLNEDRFRSAQKNTVLNLAIMNNLALQLVRIYQAISGLNLHKAKIYMRNYPLEGIQKILNVMGSKEIIGKVQKEMIRFKTFGLKEV